MKRDNTPTRRLLAEAGVEPGMRVLEIGCGGGEVSEQLAIPLGASGAVIATDRDWIVRRAGGVRRERSDDGAGSHHRNAGT